MRRFMPLCCLLLGTVASFPQAHAQDTAKDEPPASSSEAAWHFYRVTLVVEEVGANQKPVNSRTYTTIVNTNPHFRGSIRTGSRVPVPTGVAGANGPTQFQYIDTGINFDISTVAEIGHELSLSLSADINSVAGADPTVHQPLTRQNRWSAAVLVPLGKPSVVFSSDSLDSTSNLRVSMTATPLP